MTDENEVEDAEEEDEIDEDTPEQTEVMAGTFVIFDTDAFRAATNSLGIQLTDEGGLYVLDAETLRLKPLLLDDGKGAKSKLTRIQ